MNKRLLQQRIIDQLHADLSKQTAAAHLARDEAISDESRAASKYDTHGQEAAYLAEGQARLAAEVGASVTFYQSFPITESEGSTSIVIGSLVELTSGNRSDWYFLGPRAGGLEVSVEGKNILVVTPQSPLGRQLLGRKKGEGITIGASGRATKHLVNTVL